MALEIIPFSEDDLDAAANLVAARYTAAAHTLLPERYTDPDAILPRLQRLFESAPGVAAISDGRLAGFLLAHLFSNRGERMAYVPDLGHAADEEGVSRIYRAMYAELARTWLGWGAFCHAMTLYPHEQEAMDAWFSLGFGMLVIDALRDLEPPPSTAASAEVRRATADDLDDFATLMLGIWRHLADSPIFIPLLVTDRREEDAQWLSQEDHGLWLAYQDRRPVGFIKLEPSRGQVLPVAQERIMACTGAYTEPDLRGQGVGTALLAEGLAWARARGYQKCSVDFESANIPGSAFWLRSGFRPVAYSLKRQVDPRLAWANPRRPDENLLAAYQGNMTIS